MFEKRDMVKVELELSRDYAKVLYSRLDVYLSDHKTTWVVPLMEREIGMALLAGLQEALK